MNIAHYLLATAMKRSATSTGLYQFGDNPATTPEMFLSKIAGRVEQLSGSVTEGEMVLVASGRDFDFFIDLFALWTLGAIAIPYSPADGPEYLQQIRQISGADYCLNGHLSTPKTYSHLTIEDINFTDREPELPCAVLFTSGSTGTPKGVLLSQYSLLNNAIATLSITRLEKERLFVNVPFHFTSAICHFLSACLSESTFLGSETRLIFSDFVQQFVSLQATGIGGAPVQLRWLAEASGANADYLKSSLNFAFSSGDHLAVEISEKLRTNYPKCQLFTVYGLTELGGRFCILRPEETTCHAGSVGRPIPGLTVEVVDANSGEPKHAGDEGIIVAAGELVASGYLNNPVETSEAFRRGNLYTGDLGYIDINGYVFVTGRENDVFKVNGKKVSAQKISSALMLSDYFSDAAVISFHIPIFGTVPIACCVITEGKEFKRGEVLKLLRETLPNNHIPHDFVMLEEIPRTGSGKVKRAELKTLVEQRLNYAI
ncbi:MAG: class I adenylate-forming enzyme family protein [Gammaproteobacteria bacterium]